MEPRCCWGGGRQSNLLSAFDQLLAAVGTNSKILAEVSIRFDAMLGVGGVSAVVGNAVYGGGGEYD